MKSALLFTKIVKKNLVGQTKKNYDNFHPIEILLSDINRALKGTFKSHVNGNDCISANTILNCNFEFINSTLLFFSNSFFTESFQLILILRILFQL